MRIVRVSLVLLLLIAFRAGVVMAQVPTEINKSSPHCGICEAAEADTWAKSAPGKIGRGLVNAGFGWTNIFAQPKNAISSGGNVFSGIAKGFGYTLLRTIQGVAELGVFWLPPTMEEPLKNCAFGDLGITGR